MSNLQKIKEACIKANPEIMELKFGCEVEYMPSGAKGTYLGLGEDPIVVAFPWGVNTEYKKFYKILGRQIRISDVLLALQNTHCDKAVMIDYNGTFWNCDDDMKNFHEVGKPWNLKEDLEHQSEETINFIAGLL